MILVETVGELRNHVARARQAGQRIGFVPTMGNLHAGHIALVHRAHELSDFVVASIFVNPMQFAPTEDLDKYPRTLTEDREKLTAAACDVLFLPSVREMYPHGMDGQTRVTVPGVSEGLCGASRPGHFEGVATVVSKLFNMVQPDVAVFGEKDFQQLAVIRKMVADLNLPIDIEGLPTVRAEDALALSSRNGYLGAEQRAKAPELYRHLRRLADAIQAGARDYADQLGRESAALEEAGFKVDYLELREPATLKPATADDRHLILLVAAYLGQTRLIDNLAFDVN
ncbi:pantoate--beta-alanine ligase [Pseudomonas matsuisoli]|uniref:Pantothenate synthetase n=1 Tax=Pseudomonas matsuisoli TaxID=1515666 RepID=A0A917PY35_9PSED|nr:pantoate--beta-alanine ligase [Pseudomonas matsuisoli]GGJ99825.1 pantothenate synthetase [Pseudomonas matsuisoli]